MACRISLEDNTDWYYYKVTDSLKEAAYDIGYDLRDTSRGAAPHYKGQLEKGITLDVTITGKGFTAEVFASAKGSNGFDYANHMHDGNYMLGQQSQAKSGGHSGISGMSFAVGKGYLKRPAEMNERAYIKYFEKALREAVGHD